MPYKFSISFLLLTIICCSCKQETCPQGCYGVVNICASGFSQEELDSCIVTFSTNGIVQPTVLHDSAWQSFYNTDTSMAFCFYMVEGYNSDVTVNFPTANRSFLISNIKISGSFTGYVDCYEGGKYSGQTNCSGGPFLGSCSVNGISTKPLFLSSVSNNGGNVYVVFLQK